jgi:hypothetical protein
MTNAAVPTDPKPAEVQVTLEERLHRAWEKYATVVYAVIALVVLGILAKGGMDYLAAQKEVDVRKAFVACTTPEAYKAFAAEHRDHPLGALAELKLADDAYITGKFTEAVSAYQKAATDLPAGVFQSRARLGAAISKLRAGQSQDGESDLRRLVGDDKEFKLIRCEAGYHLAELASAAGRATDVQKLAEQLMTIDPADPFTQRAFALRSEQAAR